MPKSSKKAYNESDIFRKFFDSYTEIVNEDYFEGVNTGEDPRVDKCESWNDLISSWEKAMQWTPQLEHGLACMLATVASTMSIGDQLWLRVVSVAGSGKSVLCEALTRNREYIYAKSTVKGFFSGYAIGGKDLSLISKIASKTFIIKDADTILQNPNKDVILSEARDIFDRNSRSDFKNGTGRNYEGIRSTMIWCGTNSIRSLDDSELGERFLDCVIMDDIDFDLEEKILWSMVEKADISMGIQSTEENTDQVDDDLDEAMALTAGYVEYLRKNAQIQMSQTAMSISEKGAIVDFARYVAFLRANYSERQFDKAEREMAGRLLNQLTRLTRTLSVVLQKPIAEIMPLVEKVAKDTAQGLSMKVVRAIMASETGAMKEKALKIKLGMVRGKELDEHLEFMKEIGIIQSKVERSRTGRTSIIKWIVTENFSRIWGNVNG